MDTPIVTIKATLKEVEMICEGLRSALAVRKEMYKDVPHNQRMQYSHRSDQMRELLGKLER